MTNVRTFFKFEQFSFWHWQILQEAKKKVFVIKAYKIFFCYPFVKWVLKTFGTFSFCRTSPRSLQSLCRLTFRSAVFRAGAANVVRVVEELPQVPKDVKKYLTMEIL